MKGTLGLRSSFSPSPPFTSISNPSNNIIGVPSIFLPFKPLNTLPSFHFKSYESTRYDFARFLVFAADNGNGGSNRESAEDLMNNNEMKQNQSNGKEKGLNGNDINSNNGEEKENGNGRPRLKLKWIDLLIDPDPDNVVAVGLTGILAWASVQVLWQLFLISIAIILAALKYSFIATLLIFILITLL